jgi:DNA-binding GntR family transcriptional regulator
MSDRGLAGGARTSVSEQVAVALREAILAGSLAPGTSLREVALAERFEVSRPTIREAIRFLVAEGLVQHHMHRGAVVAQPTPEDVVDVYRARAAVEVAAAGAVPGISERELAELGAALTAMEAAFERGDWEGTGEADLAFHRRLVALAGSPRLSSFYEHLQGELRLVLLVSERDQPDPRKVAEHRRMLDLAAAGDVEGLRAAVSAHVADAQELLVRVLRARIR